MCGIFACFGEGCDRMVAVENAHKQLHRGPDDFCCLTVTGGYCCFTRLNVMDKTDKGRQPFTHEEYVAITNGEIYNHAQLREEFGLEVNTKSDCAIIPELFSKIGAELPRRLSGMFGIIIVNNETGEVFITRDHMGIVSLYWGTDSAGRLYVASEQKCIVHLCDKVEIFPPRMYYQGPPRMGPLQEWYSPQWTPQPYDVTRERDVLDRIYRGMYQAVEKMLPADTPMGFLLSGGLDSSLVAALARRILGPDHELHTFTVGLEDAPDFKFARQVAEHIGSIHHEFTYTLREGLDLIPRVIEVIETCDSMTIRGSTPNYIVGKKISSLGFKMVLSGEGSDEAWGGYLYFHYAPNDEELHEELKDKLYDLHYFDCLRSNKSMLGSGVETRVPFLDPQLLDIAMTIPVRMKHPKYVEYKGRGIEKGVLRRACDRDNLLPESVLWRQKEGFSDAVGYGWSDGLKQHYLDMGTTEGQFNLEMYQKYNYSMTTVKIMKLACASARGASWLPKGTVNDTSGRNVSAVHQTTAIAV